MPTVPRSLFLITALAAIGFMPAHALAQRVREPERTLLGLENQWAQAVVRRDAAALGYFVAPHWVYSDETGVLDREQGIAAFTSGPDTVRVASNSGMRAFVYGDAAVVIGVLEMRGGSAGRRFLRRYRYTDTWARLDGRWQCVASQDYLLPERARVR
jgi:ketosteroid isomerase-like protein